MYNNYEALANDVDDLYTNQEGINGRLESHSFAIEGIYNDLHGQINEAKEVIEDIKNTLSQIENSKIGKKIFQ